MKDEGTADSLREMCEVLFLTKEQRGMPLQAPFPWFGGKSRVAPLVWERFGNVPNYVEPFAGSLAVLLGRPHAPGIETVNDLDCYLANFWRALQADPETLAQWVDWPVNEADLTARHQWLVNQAEFRERMKTDPDYYDVKIAGWWVWGLSAWIGHGWCDADKAERIPRQRQNLRKVGVGVHRQSVTDLIGYLQALATRLRRVRVCCGDWQRVLGESVTMGNGLTGIFLDPPYEQSQRGAKLYAVETNVSAAVREWTIANGEHPLLRIALCGYEGEHDMPRSWTKVQWKTQGGYANQGNGRGKDNASREVIYFSPHCLSARQGMLFVPVEGDA